MEYTVLNDFIDRYTLKQFRAGDIFSCSDATRAEILIKRGYVAAKEEAPEPESKKETAKTKTAAKAPAKKAASKTTVKKSKKE